MFTNSYHIYLFRSTPIIIFGGDLQGFIWELNISLHIYIYIFIYQYKYIQYKDSGVKICSRFPPPVFGRPHDHRPLTQPTETQDSMTLEVDSPRQVKG